MIRHIDVAAEQVLAFKKKNPERYQELINEGIGIGLGQESAKKERGDLTAEDVREKYLPENPAYRELTEAVIEGDAAAADALTAALLEEGMDPVDIVLHALMPGIQIVCEIYDMGEAFVPEILLSNDALVAGVTRCQEKRGDMPSAGRVASLVIEGDVHDIGKNIVAAILRANGFEIVDMGRDVPAEDVVDLVSHEKIDLVTGTSLMSTTKEGLRTLSKALEEKGVPVACGGAAVDVHFVETFQNAVYGKSPLDAVRISKMICSGMKWTDVRERMNQETVREREKSR